MQKQCFCTPFLQSHLPAYLNKVVSGFIRYSLVIFMSRKAEMISSPELCVSRQAACCKQAFSKCLVLDTLLTKVGNHLCAKGQGAPLALTQGIYYLSANSKP
jgi:hypothetical protein